MQSSKCKMIRVKDLTKIYKTQKKTGNPWADFWSRKYEEHIAVNQLSFSIERDELVGFVGPNGAGKTTTLKMLSGILYPTSGSIEVLKTNPFFKEHSFLKQIAFIMGQKNQLLWELPAIDSFLLNKEIYEISDQKYKKNLGELVEMLKVDTLINQPVKTLSLGQRMKMELISCLLHEPKVLFLDEPTIGLDIFAHTTIVNFIKEYQKSKESTIILTSHYMKDIQELASRVLLIDQGRLVYDGKLHGLLSKYSSEKILKVTLEKPLTLEQLNQFKGKANYQFPQLSLRIPKEHLNPILNKLTNMVSLIDLDISDESIEEVIKKVFQK